METYHNTMVYDGTTWTEYEDDFLSDNNSQFDPMQTLDYAIGATDTGLIVTGPVSGLGQDSMMDTWRFDASNGNWSGDTNLLYHQGKTVRNIGVSYQDKFYVLSYNGEQLIFRCADIQCAGPTANPTEIGPPYLDTPANLADNWIYDAARYMYEHGLMTGTTPTTFDPAVPITDRVTVCYCIVPYSRGTGNRLCCEIPRCIGCVGSILTLLHGRPKTVLLPVVRMAILGQQSILPGTDCNDAVPLCKTIWDMIPHKGYLWMNMWMEFCKRVCEGRHGMGVGRRHY